MYTTQSFIINSNSINKSTLAIIRDELKCRQERVDKAEKAGKNSYDLCAPSLRALLSSFPVVHASVH